MLPRLSSASSLGAWAKKPPFTFSPITSSAETVTAPTARMTTEIAAALGGFTKTTTGHERGDTIVAYARGHLVEVTASEDLLSSKGIASLPIIPKPFKLQVIRNSADVYKNLVGLLAREDVTCVVNGCDAGREGELIFRLIYEHAKCRKTMKRLWLRTMTHEGIRDAYANLDPGAKYDGLADAARCRSEADWIFGINGSRGLTHIFTLKSGQWANMSMGRVQTPTLAMLVYRAREIANFVPKDYWTVQASFLLAGGNRYQGTWTRLGALPDADADEGAEGESNNSRTRFDTQACAQAVIARCQGKPTTRITETVKPSQEHAPHLYDLTTLQREANRRYKISASRTLEIAQTLYEGKVTTYPRTAGTALPEDYVEEAKGVLGALSDPSHAPHALRILEAGWCKPNKAIFNNDKITDHFAIIPTGMRPHNLSHEEALVYDMIAKRFLAIFHPAAEYRLTQRTSYIGEDAFRSNGKVCVAIGWREVYGSELDSDKPASNSLCAMTEGEGATAQEVKAVGAKTAPPSRYTEDSLLGAMETAGKQVTDEALREALKAAGLGTPATRANIIDGLLAKRSVSGKPKEPYAEVVKEGKNEFIVATKKGTDAIDYAEQNGWSDMVSPRLTGEWEMQLRQIEAGQHTRTAFMSGIEEQIHRMIGIVRGQASSMPVAERAPAVLLPTPCPLCGSGLVVGEKQVRCQTACGYALWREVASRPLSEAELVTLQSQLAAKPDDAVLKAEADLLQRYCWYGLLMLILWMAVQAVASEAGEVIQSAALALRATGGRVGGSSGVGHSIQFCSRAMSIA